MKLLYVSNQRLPTEKAYGIQIAKTCQALADLGIQLELVVPYRRRTEGDFFEYYGIKRNFVLTRIPAPDFYWPGFWDRWAAFIKQWISARRILHQVLARKPDALYTRDELIAYLASRRGMRVYFEAHTFSLRRRWYYRQFLKNGVRLIVINNRLKEEFIKTGFPATAILVAHDGVDLVDFDINLSKIGARQQLNLLTDKKIALYSGHLFTWKGADIFAQAAALVKDVLFVLVGGLVGDVQRFKNQFDGQDNILIVGPRPHQEIPIYLRAADVLVLPNSDKETMSNLYTSPLKMFEYMASGQPIIASDIPSIREVLDEQTALFFRSDDPKDLAERIKEAIGNTSAAEKRAQEARQMVTRYTWQERAKQIKQFMDL